MATGSSISNSEEKANCFRLLSLIIDGGTFVLRHRFDQAIPPAVLHSKLNDPQIRGKLTNLSGNPKSKEVLNKSQRLTLYPSTGQVKSETFDISLLSCLLKYICGLDENSRAWSGVPPSFDTSVEADISRLRLYRNEVAHMKSLSLTSREFQQKWAEIEKIIIRLGAGIANLQQEIDNLKDGCIDPVKEAVLRKTMEEMEQMEEERLSTIEDTLQDHSGQLSVLQQDVKTNTEQISENKAKCDTIEAKVKDLSLRKESVELKSLKSMTHLHLEYDSRNQVYVYTSAYNSAKKKLEENRCVILTGMPGEGKTSMAIQIINEMTNPEMCLKLREPSDWKLVDLSWEQVLTIFIDDIFGGGALDENLLKEWTKYFPDMEKAVRSKRIFVIITCRHYILEEAKEKIRRIALFQEENIQLLASADLTKAERIHILETHLKHTNLDFNYDERFKQYSKMFFDDKDDENCIKYLSKLCDESYVRSFRRLHHDYPMHIGRNGELSEYLRQGKWTSFKAMIGFPETVKLFVNNPHILQIGPTFFEKPLVFFKKCVEDIFLNEEKKLALVLVWAKVDQALYNQELENFEVSSLGIIARKFGFKLKDKLLRLIRRSLKYHEGGYLKFDSRRGAYSFCHNVVKDMVGLVAGQENSEAVLEYASKEFLLRYVTTDKRKNDGLHVFVQGYLYPKLWSVLLKFIQLAEPQTTDGVSISTTDKENTKDGTVENKSVVYSSDDTTKDFSNATDDTSLEKWTPLKIEMMTQDEMQKDEDVGYFGPRILSISMSVRDEPLSLGEDLIDVSIWQHDAFKNENFVELLIKTTEGKEFMLKTAVKFRGQFGYYGIYLEDTDYEVLFPSRMILNRCTMMLRIYLKHLFDPRSHEANQFLVISLLLAAHVGASIATEHLLKNGAVVTEDALFIAAERQKVRVLDLLLENRGEHYTEPSNIRNKNSPLIAAARKGCHLSAECLIKHGVDVNYKNLSGRNALEKAILYKHVNVCKVLLENGANVNYTTVKFKRTPLHLVADVEWKDEQEAKSAMSLFLKHGANVYCKDNRGHYPIHCAAIRQNYGAVDALLEHDKSQASLRITSYGAKSCIKGMDLFHIAVWRENLCKGYDNADMIDVLVRHNIYPNCKDCFGRTPIYCAVLKADESEDEWTCSDSMKIIRKLLTVSDVKIAEKKGNTPLHAAIRNRRNKVASLLLPLSDINVQNKKGETPLHVACDASNIPMINILVKDCKVDIRMVTKAGENIFDIFVRKQCELFNNLKKSIGMKKIKNKSKFENKFQRQQNVIMMKIRKFCELVMDSDPEFTEQCWTKIEQKYASQEFY